MHCNYLVWCKSVVMCCVLFPHALYQNVYILYMYVFPLQAIFLAHGPAFKEGYLAPAFDNIQIYNLLCGECWPCCSVRTVCELECCVHVLYICTFDVSPSTLWQSLWDSTLCSSRKSHNTAHFVYYYTPPVMGQCSKKCDSKAQLLSPHFKNSSSQSDPPSHWGGVLGETECIWWNICDSLP